jgi:hypothetical protein
MSWQRWLVMAQESEVAAGLLAGNGIFRPAASRYYYAAFQAATAMLHYQGKLAPPIIEGIRWEHWGHDKTPKMISDNLKEIIPSQVKRRDLRGKLELLYRMRLFADYATQEVITKKQLYLLKRNARFIVKVALQTTGGLENKR